jgi:hypothetical protein
MEDPDVERALKEALKAAVPADEGFWARQRAQILSRLPERGPRRAWRWTWAPVAAAALATFLVWHRRAPAVPAGLLQDMEVVQDMEFAEDLDVLEDLDRMGEPL